MTTSTRRLPVDPARSALMRRIRQRGTKPEDAVAVIARELGLHFRRNVRSLPGSPDLANKTRKWAVFVNGCFWHRHDGCSRTTTPKTNRAFWLAKFAANVARDEAQAKSLRARGFRVVVVWECETRDRERLRRLLMKLGGVQ